MRINLSDKDKFILRVAGVFLHKGHVLLHRAENDDIWALPGGGCHFFEDTKQALIRELQEELKASVSIQSLAFAVENFFNWNNQRAHEIGFYYLTAFSGDSVQYYDQEEFIGIEEHMEGFSNFRLHFKWFPIDSLSTLNVKPDFLKIRLQSINGNALHILNRDH